MPVPRMFSGEIFQKPRLPRIQAIAIFSMREIFTHPA